MRITVRYLAQLRQATGVAEETLDIPNGCTLSQLVELLAERHGPAWSHAVITESGQVRPTILLFVNDVQQPEQTRLNDGDEVAFLSPIAGGAA